MQTRFVERGQRRLRMINDLGLAIGGETHQSRIRILGVVVLAVHVQQDTSPDLATFHFLTEQVHPLWVDQKEIQTKARGMVLDAMNEKIIGVQRVCHYQVVNPSHREIILGRQSQCQCRGGMCSKAHLGSVCH